MRRHRIGAFYKKLKKLNRPRTSATTSILDENDQPTRTLEESLSRWRRHFNKVLNIEREVTDSTLWDGK